MLCRLLRLEKTGHAWDGFVGVVEFKEPSCSEREKTHDHVSPSGLMRPSRITPDSGNIDLSFLAS